jgi:hypothetical protein
MEDHSMTRLAKTNGFLGITPGTKLLGEIITWTCGGIQVRHIDLVTALRDAELDETVARELAPRHAFSRACKKLSEARIIRQVAEDAKAVTFQFTAEKREGDRSEYELETLLTLDKGSGKVSCPLPGLATLAQEQLDRAIEARTGGDVTRIVQRLFERQADLFPIRPAGGAYFTPQEHAAFVDKVQAFLGKINGQLLRFPVPAGTRPIPPARDQCHLPSLLAGGVGPEGPTLHGGPPSSTACGRAGGAACRAAVAGSGLPPDSLRRSESCSASRTAVSGRSSGCGSTQLARSWTCDCGTPRCKRWVAHCMPLGAPCVRSPVSSWCQMTPRA